MVYLLFCCSYLTYTALLCVYVGLFVCVCMCVYMIVLMYDRVYVRAATLELKSIKLSSLDNLEKEKGGMRKNSDREI